MEQQKPDKVTHGLLCFMCGSHAVRMISKYAEHKAEYYNHFCKCEACGHVCFPTGMLPYMLETWEEATLKEFNFRKAQGTTKQEPHQMNLFELINGGKE